MLPKLEGGKAQIPGNPSDAESFFPVVGIGASAGGLAAFEQFFAQMPQTTESGMTFVLVQHLSPHHKSILADLVKRYTEMQVFEVTDGVEIQPNCAYIIPPNKDLALMHGKLHLMDPVEVKGLRLPIDRFFRSLAQDQQERAICIVLSGTGTDGTLGLKEVKGQGGMTMVQAPDTTEYDGMPRSAIATGMVDVVLPPADMPAQLIAYAEHAFGRRDAPPPPPDKVPDLMQKVYLLVRSQTGHDFSQYKQKTIRRRVERRLAVHQIEDLDTYVRHLQRDPMELDALFRDLLIGVTSFFRDPEAFQILEQQAMVPLLARHAQGQPLRVWVPGCSSGEEAYSVAMLLQETMEACDRHLKVQIFATDIDAEAIERARLGAYPDSIAADVSPERLARFFRRDMDNNTYTVRKTLRDTIVFALQNVIGDPPFSRIDLISCRNLLIYLGSELQKRVLPLFHYALNPQGYLFLGSSESTGDFSDLFAVTDRKAKLFQRQEVDRLPHAPIEFGPAVRDGMPASRGAGAGAAELKLGIRELTEKMLLADHTPASVVINAKGEILYIHGHTGRYLEPAPGTASLNIIHMARQGLQMGLTTAIRRAASEQITVQQKGIQVRSNGGISLIDLVVEPIRDPAEVRGLLLVLFQPVQPPDASEEREASTSPVTDKDQRIADLERELRAKDEYLQTNIEELETSNEELKSMNEEMQSSNEELQSTNEELETSKEEIQSVNEELTTVNTELQQKIDELSKTNDDMRNLLAGTGVGTVFVDHQQVIRRFTPQATQVINLIPSDVGRPLGHIVSRLPAYDRLVHDVQSVLDTLVPCEIEAQTEDGRWYLMRILPYRTQANVIDGAVLTFVDITAQKDTQMQLGRTVDELEAARDLAQGVVDTVRQPLLVLDADLRVMSANPAFCRVFQVPTDETEGQRLYDLGNRQWDIPELRRLLEEILPQDTHFDGYPVEHEFESIGAKTMLLNARRIERADLILLAIDDVTGHD